MTFSGTEQSRRDDPAAENIWMFLIFGGRGRNRTYNLSVKSCHEADFHRFE
jgi:hypothetical protein